MKKSILLVIVVICTMVSCDFGDTNVDPNNLSEASVSLKDILPAMQSQSMYNIGALGGRMPGILTQHFFGFDAQQVPYSTYSINESDLNNLWVTGLYVGSMKDADVLVDLATAQEQPQYVGIAKIFLAQNLGLATQFWGDVPFSQAFDGNEFPKAVFDTQEEVYASIQRLLDEAITALSEPVPASGFVGSDDLIYGGDNAAWIRTARSLKARYHIQLSQQDANAASSALAAISSGAITSVAEEPMFVFDAAVTGANPYAQFGEQRPKTLVVANEFADLMMSKSDPRMGLYMAQDGDEWLFFAGQTSDLFWSQNESPLPIISFTEIKFIEAEAELISGNVAEAESALQAAVEASMDQLGVSDAESQDYIDTYGNFGTASTFEQRLERIIDEKYVALYSQAEPEIWSDFRRTGYPALTARAGGSNGNNPSGIIPERFIYPIDERVTNTDNLNTAIERQGGGLMDDNLWAFPN
ncbi:MAG: SusD/RagB family nutrient-binding outer membrane lipoprotein [Bacteroidota bacterium]